MKFNPLVFMAFCLAAFFLHPTLIAAQDAKASADKKAPADSEVYDLKAVDMKPAAKGTRATPVYPYQMWVEKIPGEVVLEFIVNQKGIPQGFKVVRSSHQAFEKPAIEAVQKWRFRPAQKNGKAVSCRMRIPIAFSFR